MVLKIGKVRGVLADRVKTDLTHATDDELSSELASETVTIIESITKFEREVRRKWVDKGMPDPMVRVFSDGNNEWHIVTGGEGKAVKGRKYAMGYFLIQTQFPNQLSAEWQEMDMLKDANSFLEHHRQGRVEKAYVLLWRLAKMNTLYRLEQSAEEDVRRSRKTQESTSFAGAESSKKHSKKRNERFEEIERLLDEGSTLSAAFRRCEKKGLGTAGAIRKQWYNHHPLKKL